MHPAHESSVCGALKAKPLPRCRWLWPSSRAPPHRGWEQEGAGSPSTRTGGAASRSGEALISTAQLPAQRVQPAPSALTFSGFKSTSRGLPFEIKILFFFFLFSPSKLSRKQGICLAILKYTQIFTVPFSRLSWKLRHFER